MKKSIIRLLPFLMLLLVSACSSALTTPVVQEGTKTESQPEWVRTLGRYATGIGAIGSAPQSPLGTQTQRNQAIMTARNQLAAQLQTILQNAATETEKQLQEASPSRASVIASVFTENTTRQIANEVLVGSTPIEQWKDPQSNELYVWVVIEEKNAIPQIRASMSKKLSAAGAEHQESLTLMDQNIDKGYEQLGKKRP
ncbi:MAG: LPP20 family lipoprotein [SAR324 cluster bacterium]|nr:LPP20 family lipoprotein [SAR324 cluster bacterium]MBF0349957.1 LPP20 family lipoprotein [SAR324 cluster bacterium]